MEVTSGNEFPRYVFGKVWKRLWEVCGVPLNKARYQAPAPRDKFTLPQIEACSNDTCATAHSCNHQVKAVPDTIMYPFEVRTTPVVRVRWPAVPRSPPHTRSWPLLVHCEPAIPSRSLKRTDLIIIISTESSCLTRRVIKSDGNQQPDPAPDC